MKQRIVFGSNLYSVRDLSGVYSQVAVFATSATVAKRTGLAVMFGCSLDKVDEQIVAETLSRLEVTGHNVREFDRDDWNASCAGTEGWPDEHGIKRVPPVIREQYGFKVIADARGIEARFCDDGWFLNVKLPTQMAAAWFVASLPRELSPEFCEALGFVVL